MMICSEKKEIYILSKISAAILDCIENIFYRHGKWVSTRPILVIAVMVFISLISSLGFLNLHLESKPDKLWIPQNSEFVKTLEWQKENFPDNQRLEMILFEAENILTPKYIREMNKVRKRISHLEITDSKGRNHTHEDLCLRVPALGGEAKEKIQILRRQLFNETDLNDFDWSQRLEQNVYCQFYESMKTSCLYLSILDLWPTDDSIIESLSPLDIIQAINTVTESATYAYPIDFTKYLGGITRNSSGHVVAAKSAIHIWAMEINKTEISINERKLSAGLSSEVDEPLFIWEGEFIKVILEEIKLKSGITMYPQAIRSFGEVSEETIFGDVGFLIFGMFILFIYLLIMLGKFNAVETRPVLSGLGLLSIQLSVILSFGLCAAFGVVYGPIHSILPLLLLGLGVDDMFVIVQTWENNSKSQVPYKHSLEERMAETLKSAGAAITVTSLTDFLAFGIGSLTGLPALHSFCIYAAVGVVTLYIMQITFFFAVFTLDQRRLEDSRNGFIWCYKHANWEPNSCSQNNYCQIIIEKIYSKHLLRPIVKIIVLAGTIVFTSLCIWGVTNLKQDFNIIWFIPRSSYVSKFLLRVEHFYPQNGASGYVYISQPDFPRELPKLMELTDALDESKSISSVSCWFKPLWHYTLRATGVNLERSNVSSEFFFKNLGKFLFSPSGVQFQSSFHFNQSLQCGQPAPYIMATKFAYRHTRLEERDDQIEAMEQMQFMVQNTGFSGYASAISLSYNAWETNKIIVQELIQNLSLALASVFFMTTLLIANIITSLLVLACVLLTLIDVMALMCWWRLTIDTVTCINLVLCVGLSVDYSAHIALHFMKVSGSRDERVIKTLCEVGPPVFNGAFSTFLTFVFLANSDSHVFESFFKIFFGVFIYGVFHGLVFLPVVLSLIGPSPHYRKKEEPTDYDPSSAVSKNENTTTYAFTEITK